MIEKRPTILDLRRENGDNGPDASNDANIGLRHENTAREGGALILAVVLIKNQAAVQDEGTLNFGTLNFWISNRLQTARDPSRSVNSMLKQLSQPSDEKKVKEIIITDHYAVSSTANHGRHSVQDLLRELPPGRYLPVN